MQYLKIIRILYIVVLCLLPIIFALFAFMAFKVYPSFKKLYEKKDSLKKEARPYFDEYNALKELLNEGKQFDEKRLNELHQIRESYQNKLIECQEEIEYKKKFVTFTIGTAVAEVLLGIVFFLFIE